MMKSATSMRILLFAVLLAVMSMGVSAYTVTYRFYDGLSGQPIDNVDVWVYPCLDNGCNSIDMGHPLAGSGSSGSSSSATITYPKNPMTLYGYADYQFHAGYKPKAYLDTFHGTGSQAYRTDFYKKDGCEAPVDVTLIEQDAQSGRRVVAQVQSALTEANSLVNFELPGYAEFYSSDTNITFEIRNSQGVLVFTETYHRSIYMDTTETIRSTYVLLYPGTYTALVRADVADDKCSSQVSQEDIMQFTVPGAVYACNDGIDNDGDNLTDYPADPGCASAQDDDESNPSLNVTLIPSPANGQAPLDVIFTCTVSNGIGPFNFDFNPDMAGITWHIGAGNATWQQFIAEAYPAGTYAPSCTVTDTNNSLEGTAVTAVNVTPQPLPQCSDSLDNDADGLADYPADPGCENLTDDDEYNAPVCQTHIGITHVEMSSAEIIEGSTFHVNNADVANEMIPFDYVFNNNGSAIHYVNYTTMFENAITGETWGSVSTTPSIPAFTEQLESENLDVSGVSNSTYNVTIFVEGIDASGCYQYDAFEFYALVNNSAQSYDCSDGIDNDADGLADYPSDPGCFNATDDDETNIVTLPECSDSIDNDADGAIDYPADFSCSSAADDNETSPVSQCQDGMDNDADGLVDYPADPGCASAQDDDEYNLVCQNHMGISGVWMGPTGIFEWVTYSADNSDIANGHIHFDYDLTNTGSAVSGLNYTTTMVERASGIPYSSTSTTPAIPANTTRLASEDLSVPHDLNNGLYNLSVSVQGYDMYGCYQHDSFGFYILVNRSAQLYACNDGIDNDHDGLADYPADPGCLNSTDSDEYNSAASHQCSDYIDNDGDGFLDANDPGCYDTGSYNPDDDNEADTLPECTDHFDNDRDGTIDFPGDSGCENPVDDDEREDQNQAPVVFLVFPFDNTTLGIDDIGFIYGVVDDNSMFVDCTLYNDINGSFVPVQTQTIFSDMYGVFQVDNIANGTYRWNVRCSDGMLSASAPRNWTFTINTSVQTYVCGDGIDNDGDGLVDMNDPGCSSPFDSDEYNAPQPAQCADGIDNDNDGLIDLNDPDCQNSQDISESGTSGDDDGGDGQEGDDEEEDILDPEQLLYIGHIGISSITHPSLAEELAYPGDEVEVSVYIENIAPYDLEDLRLSVYIDSLGIWRTIGPFDLEEGEHTTKHVVLDIPSDADEDPHDVRIVVRGITRVKYRLLEVV